MISYIEGTVVWVDGKSLIVKTLTGIGYSLYYLGSAQVGDQVAYFVTTVKRENADEYFAFDSYSEKEFYELLLTVKGVGPKTAFTVLSQLSRDELIKAVLLEDKGAFKKIPGIGPKTASQIILDLSSKVKTLEYRLPLKSAGKTSKGAIGPIPNVIVDATMALKELGYNDITISPVLTNIYDREVHHSPEVLLRDALKHLN